MFMSSVLKYFCNFFAIAKFIGLSTPPLYPLQPSSLPFDVKIRPLTQMDYEIFNTQIYKKEV